MHNHTETYPALSSPSDATFASLYEAIAEFQLTAISYWGDRQRDFIARCTTPLVRLESALAPRTDAGLGLPEDTVAGAGDQNGDENGAAVDQPVSHNAAMAILTHPALASAAATRSSNDTVTEDVRDDVADDIAAQIEREVRQELEPPAT